MPKPLPSSSSTNYWAEIPESLKNGVHDIFSVMAEEGREITKVDDGRLILGTLRRTKPATIKASDLGLRLVLDVTHKQLQDRMMALSEEELAWVKGEEIPNEPSDDPVIEDHIEATSTKKKKKDPIQAVSDTFDAIRSERNYSMGDKLEEQLAEARLSEPPPADFTDEEVKVYRIFERFDIDGDGFLNYQEVRSLITQVKNGDILSLEAYIDMCKTLEDDPALGITKQSLRKLYKTGYSVLDRDYELLFQPFDTRTMLSDSESFFSPHATPHGMMPSYNAASFEIDSVIRAKVTELFARFDSNQDGYWSFSELVEFVTVTDPSRDVTYQDYDNFCEALGCDPRKGITFDSLLAFYANGEASLDSDYYTVFPPSQQPIERPRADLDEAYAKVQRIFQSFDVDDDGYLNRYEMSMVLSATSPNTTMLSESKFGQRCKLLNCDPSKGITLQGLYDLYSSLDPVFLDNDYRTIFKNEPLPAVPPVNGWSPHNHEPDHDTVIKVMNSELTEELYIPCGKKFCNGMIRPNLNSKQLRCVFCLQDRYPTHGFASCPRCSYSLCFECFHEMVDFKQSFRQTQPASSYAPSVTSVATSGFLRDFAPFAVDFDRQSVQSIPTVSGRSVRVLEPIQEAPHHRSRKRPRANTGSSKRHRSKYESNEAYENLNQQQWDSLMEDITVMKRLMAQISHAVTLIKQRKVTKKKERSKLYKKMQGWRDNLMALLGKYGAQDHKSGVRVMRRALENFKRYKQKAVHLERAKYKVIFTKSCGFDMSPGPGGIGAYVRKVVNSQAKKKITEGSMILAINGNDVSLNDFSFVYSAVQTAERPMTIIFSNPSISDLTE